MMKTAAQMAADAGIYCEVSWNAGWAVAREHAWRVFAIKLTAGITKSVLTDRYSMHRRFAYEY